MLINWDQVDPAGSIRAGAMRKFVTGQQSSVVWVDTKPTAEFDGRPHRHVHEQWIVVVAGRLSVACDGVKSDLRAGDVAYIAANSWHVAVGVGSEGARYLEFSTPPRLDLLPASIVPNAMEFFPITDSPR